MHTLILSYDYYYIIIISYHCLTSFLLFFAYLLNWEALEIYFSYEANI